MNRLFVTAFLTTVCIFPVLSHAQFEPSTPGGGNGKAAELNFEPSSVYRDVEKKGERSYEARPCAAPNPTNGPKETFLYKNAAGKFKIPDITSVNGGKANYTWLDGSKQEDTLTYISHGYVTEKEGYLIPAGTKVSVWAYMAQDVTGNHFFIYFGTDPIIRAPQGKRYPLYYSFGPPGNAPTMRWVTSSGTTRD